MRTTVMRPATRFTSLVAVALFVGCQAKIDFPSTTPERPSSSRKDPARMSAADLQQFVSTNAAVAGADSVAGQTQLPTAPIAKEPEEPIRTKPVIVPAPTIILPEMTLNIESKSPSAHSVISIPKIRSAAPQETEADAKLDACQVAAKKLMLKLQQMDPPVVTNITANRVWYEYVVPNSAKKVPLPDDEVATLGTSKAGANRTYYEIDVEMTETQVRSLRSEQRLLRLAPFAAAFLVFCGIGNVLFRIGGAFSKK